MQFLPSTWQAWGIDGFGETGPPDVMDPFDAVPSAARLLCADGATAGAQGLRQAIFDYNHADWYVDEVLTLAAEYAASTELPGCRDRGCQRPARRPRATLGRPAR